MFEAVEISDGNGQLSVWFYWVFAVVFSLFQRSGLVLRRTVSISPDTAPRYKYFWILLWL